MFAPTPKPPTLPAPNQPRPEQGAFLPGVEPLGGGFQPEPMGQPAPLNQSPTTQPGGMTMPRMPTLNEKPGLNTPPSDNNFRGPMPFDGPGTDPFPREPVTGGPQSMAKPMAGPMAAPQGGRPAKPQGAQDMPPPVMAPRNPGYSPQTPAVPGLAPNQQLAPPVGV